MRARKGFTRWIVTSVLALGVCAAGAFPAVWGETIGKLLYLVVDGNTLIAANSRLSRIDERTLDAKESVQEKVVADAVAVVITNQRILGYSALTGTWVEVRVRAKESLVSAEAEDSSALVITTDRILSFSGERGVWVAKRR